MNQAKDTAGKLQLSLVPPALVEEVARVRMYGTEKYGSPHNWREVDPLDYLDAALRHLFAYVKGEDVDKESELPHLAHAACNLAFLLEMDREEARP